MGKMIVRLWRRGFLSALNRGGDPHISDEDLIARATSLAARRHLVADDGQTELTHALATGLHAATELLEEAGLSRREARDRAGAAFLKSGQSLARWSMRLWLWVTPDPVGHAKAGNKLAERARMAWGGGLKAHQENGPDHATLMVTECVFVDYFWDAGRSDLTPILCAWDAQWMEIVNASDRPVSVSRSGTLAQGCEACDFCFKREAKLVYSAPFWERLRGPGHGHG